MSRQYDIALLGVDGLAGQALLELLEERQFPVGRLFPLVAEEGEQDSIRFAGKTLGVELAADFEWSQVQLAFFMADADASLRWAEAAAEAGCMVIDASQALNSWPDVPLVIPQVNHELLAEVRQTNLVASPCASATALALALKPIHDLVGIERINVVSLQTVSGSGQSGVDELARQTASLLNGRPVEPHQYPLQIAFNLLPQVDELDEDGASVEERRLQSQIRCLLGDHGLGVNVTCIRVPVFFGHAQVVHLETRSPSSVDEIRHCLMQVEGLVLEDEAMVTPVTHGVGNEQVYLSRLRQDDSHPHGIDFWLVADNSRQGDAGNCLRIAEYLIREHW